MNDDIQVLDTGQDTDTSTYTPYEMIEFENGTLVTPASADLETGQVTMPVYSGKAPINATNLNHLEQGLKNLEEYILSGGVIGGGGGNAPIGSVMIWHGSTAPSGYLICDGTTYSKSQYPDLYDALGSDYQISAEQFKVPDFRGLVPIGAGTHQDTNSKSKTFTLGTEYGEYEHTQTIEELVNHNHTINRGADGSSYYGITGKEPENQTPYALETSSTGGGQPFNVMQPSLTVNYIIKAIKSETILAEVENSLVSNSTVNAPSIYSVNEGINNINKNCINLGGTNNETKTITLTNGTLNDYRFLCVSSGWGTQKSTTTIPISVFKLIGAGFEQCKQYVKTYNASAYTSIQYVNDTSFIINGAVGTDTVTDVYGIK
mgnify:CR=1 FL=1